jgi:hypothetical protein
LNIFGKWKTNSTATGPKPRSAQLHSRAWPTLIASAQPVCIAHTAHGFPGRPRPARTATAQRGARAHAGAVTALRARIAALEVEQTTALEHPRWRGYPLGMGVEAIAHRSSLSTGRGRKTGSVAVFSGEARAPVAGGGPATGRRRRVTGYGDVSVALGQQWGRASESGEAASDRSSAGKRRRVVPTAHLRHASGMARCGPSAESGG